MAASGFGGEGDRFYFLRRSGTPGLEPIIRFCQTINVIIITIEMHDAVQRELFRSASSPMAVPLF